MIKLYGFMPAWGLIDPSTYVTKAMTLFKMANVPFERCRADLESVSKHKAPYIVLSDGSLIQDSTFIKAYLERQGADFSGGYTARELAFGFGLERLCENHLNWILTNGRWLNDENFKKGPRMFFMGAPEAIRDTVIEKVKAEVAAGHWAHGISRHSEEEIFELGRLDIDALNDALGDNDFILGQRPCGFDASIFASLYGLSTPHFDIPTGAYVRENRRLMAYIDRMKALYISD